MPGTRTGAANTWSAITPDPANGLVFVPTASPSPDYDVASQPALITVQGKQAKPIFGVEERPVPKSGTFKWEVPAGEIPWLKGHPE